MNRLIWYSYGKILFILVVIKNFNFKEIMDNKKKQVIFFYDGECGFCNATVQFLLINSDFNELVFAPLQSEIAKNLFKQENLGNPDFSAAYFWDRKIYVASDAILHAVGYTKAPYNWLKWLIFVPKVIRNSIYYMIAKNRKKIPFFRPSCRILTPFEKQRFIAY